MRDPALMVKHRLLQEDIADFATLSGDTNPIHLTSDGVGAFGKPVAHGMWLFRVFAEMIHERVPERKIQSFDLIFPAPAKVGDMLIFTARPTAQATYSVSCTIESNGDTCLTGSIELEAP